MKNPKYQIKKSTNNQFFWVLISVNGEPILKSSETYVSKQGCQTSITSSKNNLNDDNFKRAKSVSSQYYFTQVASNGLKLGISEMYQTLQGCENGVAAVKRDSPIASIEDLTS